MGQILDKYYDQIQGLDYKTAQDHLKRDENFLCALEIKDQHFDVYLFHYDGFHNLYLAFFNGKLLFSGDSFRPALVHEHDSLENAVTLLSWLCLKKGDTDKEFFNSYTDQQLKWSESNYCENLRLYINIFEQPEDCEYTEAKNYFTNWFTN